MPLNLGFIAKYIRNPWIISVHPVEAPLNSFAILLRIFLPYCEVLCYRKVLRMKRFELINFERSSNDSNTYVALYLWIRFPRHSCCSACWWWVGVVWAKPRGSWEVEGAGGWRWGRSASARLGDQPCPLWRTKNNMLVRAAVFVAWKKEKWILPSVWVSLCLLYSSFCW